MRSLCAALLMLLASPALAQQGATVKSGLPVTIVETPEQSSHSSEREAASDKHDAADLKAQERAAEAADRAATAAERQVVTGWWQVGIGAAGTLALLATILLSVRATNAAVAANRIAQEHFIAENRPWLSLGEPVFAVHSDDGSSPIVVAKVEVTNVGRSPALNVHLHVKTQPMAMNYENSKAAEQFAAEVAKPTALRWGNRVIFPDNTEEITGMSDGIDDVPKGTRYLRVIFCATCRGVTGDTVFHAASAYRFDADVLSDLIEVNGATYQPVQAMRIKGSNSIG